MFVSYSWFEPDWSKFTFDLTLTSDDLGQYHSWMFVSYSPHIQVYSHQVRAQSEEVKNLSWPWPWPMSFSMFVASRFIFNTFEPNQSIAGQTHTPYRHTHYFSFSNTLNMFFNFGGHPDLANIVGNSPLGNSRYAACSMRYANPTCPFYHIFFMFPGWICIQFS